MLSSESKLSQQLNEQLLIQEICSAPNALVAHRRFERSANELKDWQIIFAEESDAGSIKLLDQSLGSSGIATSIFRGKSLWLMDTAFVTQSGSVGFKGGTATFLDSNSASYIRKIAYDDTPSQEELNRATLINQIGPKLQQLNPYLYLWESLRFWNADTATRCKQSVAAIHALSASGSKLTAEWGRRYRSAFRERAENFAIGFLAEFERKIKGGLLIGLDNQLALIEIILLQTQIIELSSKKARVQKLSQLVTFMHEELATMMMRELIVCGDILLRSEQSSIARKLNSIQNHSDPLKLIRNCAWDIYIPRIMDALTAITPDQTPNVDFYVAELVSFDGDVSDILNSTKLRALAVHRPSKQNLPFFDTDIAQWLGNRLESKRFDTLSDYFTPDAFIDRAKRRPTKSLHLILKAAREELMQLISMINSGRIKGAALKGSH